MVVLFINRLCRYGAVSLSTLKVGRDHAVFPLFMKYLSDESAIEQTVTGCSPSRSQLQDAIRVSK